MDRDEAADLLSQLRRDAALLADRFQLRYRDIAAEHPRVKARYGACYSDGLIKIRLNHARTGRPLRYSSLIDTLCHELAHLKHFNHGPDFKTFYLQLLGWARRQGIYRPQTARSGPQDQPSRLQAAGRPRHPLPERNGVLVFPTWTTPAEAIRQPPWERHAATPPATTPPTAPCQATQQTQRQPRQPAPAASASAGAAVSNRPPAAPAEGRQLTLF